MSASCSGGQHLPCEITHCFLPSIRNGVCYKHAHLEAGAELGWPRSRSKPPNYLSPQISPWAQVSPHQLQGSWRLQAARLLQPKPVPPAPHGWALCRRCLCSEVPALPISRWAATHAKEIPQTVQTGISIDFLRTPLLLMTAIAAPRCMIALSTVLMQGKAIPCTLIVCTNYGVFSSSYGLEKDL